LIFCPKKPKFVFYFSLLNNIIQMLDLNHVYEMDVIEGLKRLPEKSVNLFIIDPPYYRVKGDFDFVLTWGEWLKLHEGLAVECKRVMAENGTLFLWGHAKNIAYQQIIFDKHFNLENNLIWEKIECQTKRQDFEQARCFAPVTERVLMYGSKSETYLTELGLINNDFQNYSTIREWIKTEREKIPHSLIYLNKHIFGYENGKDGVAGNKLSPFKANWQFPDGENYNKIKDWCRANGYDAFQRDYTNLRQEYEHLRQEYEHFRRPFFNTDKLTDVLFFSQESHITTDYDHETKKPEGLTTALIETCSRPGDLVCAPFAGSGTECAMAAKLGRRWIGFDNVPAYVKMSNDRANKMAVRVDVTRPIKDATDYTTLNTGLFAHNI